MKCEIRLKSHVKIRNTIKITNAKYEVRLKSPVKNTK